jgi:hypothetical protein
MKKLLFLSLLGVLVIASRQGYLFARNYMSKSDYQACAQQGQAESAQAVQGNSDLSSTAGSSDYVCHKCERVKKRCRNTDALCNTCKKREKRRRRKTAEETSPYGQSDYNSPAESVFGNQATRGMSSPSLTVSGMSESGTFGR